MKKPSPAQTGADLPSLLASPAKTKAALRRLSMQDADLAALIARTGPPRLTIEADRTPCEALIRAVAHQQLHARAAEAILTRFLALFPDNMRFPPPEAVMAVSDETLRLCGFSAAKLTTIRGICAAALDGTVPERAVCATLDDEALIQRLTALRGIGRWTVEIMLIFTLGRPDVLPVDDLGVRDGWRRIKNLDASPKPKELAGIGGAWAPWRSLAAWYLWRSSDEGKKASQPQIPAA